MADTMRGHVKQDQYGRFILPLMLARRLDCSLAPAGAGGEIGPIARGDPARVRDRLLDWISTLSPDVRDVLITCFRLPERLRTLEARGLLGGLLSAVAGLDLRARPEGDAQAAGVSNAEMGTLFEHLIRRFSEAENAEAGEHFTPPDVVRLIADLLVAGDLGLRHAQGARPPTRDVYDPACGTGRMLMVGEDRIRRLTSGAAVTLFGQELNEESFAICAADMLMQGRDPSLIRLGNTLIDDRHADRGFHLMMANPPFGGAWKTEAASIEREARRPGSRFGPGLPRRTDAQMLFLLHMLAKMRPDGSRIGIVMNGSPLFAGRPGQGENRIRRWIFEHDWLETVICLPEQIFYNTGIATYLWILANRKSPERAGLVQLIDASGPAFWQQMPKGLGNKRRFLPDSSIDAIGDLHAHLGAPGPLQAFSKTLPTTAFGYRRYTLRIPTFDGSPAALAHVKRCLQAEHWTTGRIDATVGVLAGFPASARCNVAGFDSALRAADRDRRFGAKLTAKERRQLRAAVVEIETEQVPLDRDITAHMADHFVPMAPGAEVDDSVVDECDGAPGQVGYEIPVAMLFNQTRSHRPLEAIDADIRQLGVEITLALADVTR